ncbi:conserved hypothetical protein [Bathymodiolus platifrons methanotrophic gill symbiont]|uniref:DUF2956 domain-containing protein n=1 Tax=Bathymodiolus platifrons methanotrophic gill symbiont TaxID=113268 RepID=UPI000B4225A0|nr:DUF2956 domain-containing protein [Bathymodiolus platifrons methanotrophic gill symbiont]TXK93020.1 DUF2956 domain-containing protein [Methylococcaceae bacterium CS5]TXK94330.1 DUF2956 domain-containing protein [Methylococcaceae bacterium CS4]TXL03762.1 DUF2956 domain-containing protein [Methylococcaceae bacterium CS1]TXL03985.1 DUF2956 domain-containing protein [Methylococcaceae bacterium CS3]TXL10448.1 DUF2956 domain-containing protein [Methylococcaceae bacterium CS2]TXL15903.1 DUF2956 d
MSRYTKKQQTSPETHDESVKLAKAIQRPGQTKEQTKLIAQGIQKGIELYKKQQKERSRELSKKLKRVTGKLNQLDESTEHDQQEMEIIYRQSYLAWILLLLSWGGFAAYFILPQI